MKSNAFHGIVAGLALAAVVGTSLAADKLVDVGKGEYDAACASCHGLQGLGDGPAAEQMKTKVPDITGLAKANNGVFPFDRVHRIIDGREDIKAHGSREMPIWGLAFRRQSSIYYDTYPVADPESGARSRILALTEYVYRLQRK